jgi:predicted transcriptional regulator
MPLPTVSRNAKKLEVGYKFVVPRDEVSGGSRHNAVYLTDKGKAFVNRIKTMIEDK